MEQQHQPLTVQIYGLKQNLTKKDLQDMLTPLIESIDFKKKIAGADEPSNDLIINEEKEDVFVRFESVDKLNEAFRMFNIQSNNEAAMKPPPPFSLKPITI
jgi:hypothetical protein